MMEFLDLEQPLVDRLNDQLPSNLRVLTVADLAGVTEGTQPTPAVHVKYDTYRVLETRSDGRAARVEEYWWTVVAVRNVSRMHSGEAARSEARPIVQQIKGALMGWQVDGLADPLFLANAPRAGYRAGFLYLPLAWRAHFVVSNQA